MIRLTLTTLWHVNTENTPLEKNYHFFKLIQSSYQVEKTYILPPH